MTTITMRTTTMTSGQVQKVNSSSCLSFHLAAFFFKRRVFVERKSIISTLKRDTPWRWRCMMLFREASMHITEWCVVLTIPQHLDRSFWPPRDSPTYKQTADFVNYANRINNNMNSRNVLHILELVTTLARTSHTVPKKTKTTKCCTPPKCINVH